MSRRWTCHDDIPQTISKQQGTLGDILCWFYSTYKILKRFIEVPYVHPKYLTKTEHSLTFRTGLKYILHISSTARIKSSLSTMSVNNRTMPDSIRMYIRLIITPCDVDYGTNIDLAHGCVLKPDSIITIHCFIFVKCISS